MFELFHVNLARNWVEAQLEQVDGEVWEPGDGY